MYRLVESSLAHHRPRQIGYGAVRLLIEEVAPAAETLTDQKTDHHNVENRQKAHLLDFRDGKSSGNRADYAAVYRQAALVDIEYLNRMSGVIIPFENAEVKPCADDTRDKSDENAVHQLAEIELKTRRGFVGV